MQSHERCLFMYISPSYSNYYFGGKGKGAQRLDSSWKYLITDSFTLVLGSKWHEWCKGDKVGGKVDGDFPRTQTLKRSYLDRGIFRVLSYVKDMNRFLHHTPACLQTSPVILPRVMWLKKMITVPFLTPKLIINSNKHVLTLQILSKKFIYRL